MRRSYRVLVFAQLKDELGSSTIDVELDEGATSGELRRTLIERHPRMEALFARSMIAVNAEYADDTTPLGPRDEIAIIPPVSGG